MPTSVFKAPIDDSTLMYVYDMSFPYEADWNHLNRASYKIATQAGTLYDWLAMLDSQYHSSTRWYVEKATNFRSFLTVVRQVLRSRGIPFRSKQICVNGVIDSVLLFKTSHQGPPETGVTG